jgi:quercetin dioxygenase-like cupin family protein
MTDARLVRHADIPAPRGKVNDEGGDLRVLNGSNHDLHVSVMYSRVLPGGGPRRHRHPHAEVFVVHGGSGRFEIGDERFDGEAGDVVIVPPEAWHVFTNIGDAPLQLTAIHESEHTTTTFDDGTKTDLGDTARAG